MDELSSKSGESLTESTNVPRSDSPNQANGESHHAQPGNFARAITSKRVVIPPNAKRIVKAPPAPAAPPAIEPHETIEPNGETPIYVAPIVAADVSPVESIEQPFIQPALDEFPVSMETAQTPTLEPKPSSYSENLPSPIVPSQTVSTASSPNLVKPGGLPYQPNASTFTPIAENQVKSRRGLELGLWAVAGLLLIAAVVAIVILVFPNLLPFSNPSGELATPTQVVALQPTAIPGATSTLLPTNAPTSAQLVPTSAPLIIPTPPADGQQLSILTDAALTGWVASGEDKPHYGDENLHAGTFQGKNLASVLQFNLRNLPQDTKILFAAIELTGRDGSRLDTSGDWQLDLLENSLTTDWFNATAEQIAGAKSLGSIGAPLTASDLGTARLNRFILSDSELELLQQQFKNGNAVFRLRGPSSSQDNLFTWESGASGSAINAPTLHLVYVPGTYVVITNTPQPTNVLTAAAYVVRGTDQAKRNGTPTPFPPGVATATPGGEIVVVDSSTAIPQNQETAIFLAQRATAFARTTGTYTPTPQSVVIQFPTNTPVVIPEDRLATATPIPPDADLASIPIDYQVCRCQGRIILLSTRYGGEKGSPIMLEPDGTPLGKLSGDFYYKLALAREPYSPDHTKRLIYPNNSNGVQQIGYETLATGEITFLTNFPKGIAYDASWAPDGSAVAFVSTERGNTDEIYVYDFGTEQVTRLTTAPEGLLPLSKNPSWSPDSQQIVFWSSRSGRPQIWIMNRDGSDLHNISNNDFSETVPVWVK